MQLPKPLEQLIGRLTRLPGIGRKSAQRLAFFILHLPQEEARELAEAILRVHELVRQCSVCFGVTESDPCSVCSDPRRDRGRVCVVEEAKDVLVVERTGEFHGVYHVLGGALSPLDGVGPEELRIRELLERVERGDVVEVILATNPNLAGEATAMYIWKALKPHGVSVTRIAHGVPVGGDLEYADEVTLAKALQGRREM